MYTWASGRGGEMIWLWLLAACGRPTDDYAVTLHGAGTDLSAIEALPSPMVGRIEVARYRLWGSNLGYGLTGLFGDEPRADGMGFVVGSASFGYPASTAFDRISPFLSPGPTQVGSCAVRPPGGDAAVEYVDVGDKVLLATPGQAGVTLERDPSVHPRPAGESWYVGYGNKLMPLIQEHPDLPDTWTPGALWAVSFPGTVPPSESTVGAIPYPFNDGWIQLPPDLENVTIGGAPVRAPNHGYTRGGEWTGEDDDVRYPGPFSTPMTVGWEAGRQGGKVTIVVRLHGVGVESACGCAADCGDGFTCDEGVCVGVDGATWNVLAEVACTAADDGEFIMQPEDMAGVWSQVDWVDIAGATLSVARMSESVAVVPDVLTWNGKRVGSDNNEVRLRASDILVTRLEVP